MLFSNHLREYQTECEVTCFDLIEVNVVNPFLVNGFVHLIWNGVLATENRIKFSGTKLLISVYISLNSTHLLCSVGLWVLICIYDQFVMCRVWS